MWVIIQSKKDSINGILSDSIIATEDSIIGEVYGPFNEFNMAKIFCDKIKNPNYIYKFRELNLPKNIEPFMHFDKQVRRRKYGSPIGGSN